jgi:hypothetical protein
MLFCAARKIIIGKVPSMTNEQYAFLHRTRVPNRDRWQQAIGPAGFNLRLDPALQPRINVGYVPCMLNGAKSGVEMYFEDSHEFLESFRDLADDRDCCIAFRWGGSVSECACAMIASFALAESFDAVVSYEGEPPAESLQKFREEIEEVLRHAATGA